MKKSKQAQTPFMPKCITMKQVILSLQRNSKSFVMRKLFSATFLILFFLPFSYGEQMGMQRNLSSSITDSARENSFFALDTNKVDTSLVKQIPEVVVTATRTEDSIANIGRSISVISSADIAKSGANSLAELLNLTEGIYVMGAQQNFGSNQSLFIRGANSNQSVIMIDGIPISDPSTPTNALDLSELSLSNIDHIEIVRGSHSTLYGSSAIGGVINIITNKKQKEGLNVHAMGTAGSFGKETSLIKENINMNYTLKNGIYADMTFNNTNVDGIDATVDTSHTHAVPRDKDGMTDFNFGGKLGYKTSKWDVNISGKSVEQHKDIDSRAFVDDNNYTLDFNRKLFNYSASCKLDTGFSVSMNGGYSTLDRFSLNDSSLVDNMGHYDHSYYKAEYVGQTYTNELQFHYQRQGYNITLGGGLYNQTMSQSVYSYYNGSVFENSLDSLKLDLPTNSVFILADLNGSLVSQKAKMFSLALGARNNSSKAFGNNITYQVNPIFKFSHTSSIYANLSSGYNAPSLYELYTPDKDFTSTITRGNRNLLPETSLTKEFGIYQKIDDKTGIRLGFFKTIVNNVVEYVYLWNKNTPIAALSYADYRGDTYLNLGKLTTEGIELEAHGAIGKKFLIAGHFSWLRGREDFRASDIDTVKTKDNHVQLYSNGQFLTYKYRALGLTRRPVTANLIFTYTPFSKLFVKAVINYVSKRNDVFYDYKLGPYGALGAIPVQAYTLVDFISGVQFNHSVSGLLRVENIFNVYYSEIRGFSSRGRGIYASINYTF